MNITFVCRHGSPRSRRVRIRPGKPVYKEKTKHRASSFIIEKSFILFQESCYNLLLRLFLGKTESHEFDELIAGNLSDGRLVDQACFHRVRRQFRFCHNAGVIHDNGVTGGMAGTLVVSIDHGGEYLNGIALGHGTGNDVGTAVHTVQIHAEIGLGTLFLMGHDLLMDLQLCAVGQFARGVADGIVDTLDLSGLHLHVGVFRHLDLCGGVHDASAGTGAFSIVLLNVFDFGVLADMEAVNSVMTGFLTAAVGDAAAGDDSDVAVLSHIKVIVYQILDAGLGDDHRDMDGLVDRVVFDDDIGHITHIDIVKGASLFMVVPASANTIAKLANGIADNMLTASFLAATCPKLIAPAMNVNMYQNRATQRNINQLKKDGVLFVEPDTGLLACGVVGKGKLADFATIRLMMDYALSEHPLLGKKVLVSAGPTQESLDPVRFISNHSTGKMGYAIARAAFLLGAQVKIISGPVNITLPLVEIEHITTANEMYDKKSDDTLTITFNKNRDILQALGENKKDNQVICGFAMETENLLENAKKKLINKNADMIVANSLTEQGAGFGTDTNIVTFITRDGHESLKKSSKEELGFKILMKLKEIEDEKCY